MRLGFLFFLFGTTLLFSQKKINELELLKKISLEYCKASNKQSFCKSIVFFNEYKYDSCYVYSSKAFFEAETVLERDILNYIQGTSAIHKNLFKKALSNFLKISDTSSFKSLKLLQLGVLNLNMKKYEKAINYYSKWERDSVFTKNH